MKRTIADRLQRAAERAELREQLGIRLRVGGPIGPRIKVLPVDHHIIRVHSGDAMFLCMLCGTEARPYGRGVPADQEYQPLLRCVQCDKLARHIFLELAT